MSWDTTFFDEVGQFHHKFGLGVAYTTRLTEYAGAVYAEPKFLPVDQHLFRRKFIDEELREFDQAVAAGDLPKAADALVDLTYVVLGTAQLMGLPFNDLWNAVQEANMKKVRATSGADERSKRGHRIDVVKPAGWQPPDIAGVLKRNGWVDPDEPPLTAAELGVNAEPEAAG